MINLSLTIMLLFSRYNDEGCTQMFSCLFLLVAQQKNGVLWNMWLTSRNHDLVNATYARAPGQPMIVI